MPLDQKFGNLAQASIEATTNLIGRASRGSYGPKAWICRFTEDATECESQMRDPTRPQVNQPAGRTGHFEMSEIIPPFSPHHLPLNFQPQHVTDTENGEMSAPSPLRTLECP